MGLSPDVLYRTLLSDLRSQVTDPDILTMPVLPPDCGTTDAACHSIARSFLKKLIKKNTRSMDDAALAKFLAVNSRCKEWSLAEDRRSWDDVLLGELKTTLENFFFDNYGRDPLFDCLESFCPFGRLGPGASIGAIGGDFYSKLFSSPLTATSPGLYKAYRNYVKNFPEWSNAENIRYENYGSVRIVAGNRLSFVPKTTEVSRSICTEPSLNMFFQLGLAGLLERRLEKLWGINLKTQPFKNRELARRGSLGMGFVTCDLSSASDSLSIKMMKYVLPKHVFDMLMLLRAPSSEIRGAKHELHMISTMGNGFTFPLQTILFSAIVLTAFYCRSEKVYFPRGANQGNWGVFGDDIICPDSIWPDVHRLLELLGFQINHDKTFVKGPFRESCGGDFFMGVDIRGVYVKSLDTQQDLFSIVNECNLFSTRTGVRLPQTVQLLVSKTDRTYVPRWKDSSSGLHVPYSLVEKYLPIDRATGSCLFRSWEPIGRTFRIGERYIMTPKGIRRRIYNPSGLLISLLQGSINSCAISVRHDTVRYKKKLCVAPNWDENSTWLPTQTVQPSFKVGWFPWQRWNTAVYLNLFG